MARPRRAAIAQDAPAARCVSEHCPELTETDPERLADLYEDVSPRMRAVLDLLIACAPERMTFEEVELELGWHRGRFASVFGGFRGWRGKHCLRPFHLCGPPASRDWELWLDEDQAAVLRATAERFDEPHPAR